MQGVLYKDSGVFFLMLLFSSPSPGRLSFTAPKQLLNLIAAPQMDSMDG